MTVPQGIVGQDIAARFEAGENHFVVVYVVSLVTVHESHVERESHFRNPFQSIADDEFYLRGVW